MKSFTMILCVGTLTIASLACSGATGDAILGGGADLEMARFALRGEVPIREGLAVGADPETVRLDPCDPDTPTDPATGKLLGKATIGAFVRDVDLQPVVGVEVLFSASAGVLRSMGQPVLTNERGLATDVLAVDEDDAGDIEITVASEELTEVLILPVVVEAKPPVVLSMSPDELWPPDHKLREVTAVFEGLDCDPDAVFRLVSASSNEPDNDTGDGNTGDDIQGADFGTADIQFMLRAERAGGGRGRTYTIVYELTDGAGVVSLLQATVIVPHDRGS